MRFPVVVHKDEGSSYGVTVPDLPGCFSGGDTLDEALTNAQEAIAGHIETLFMVAEPLPETRTLQEHHANEDYRDAQYWGFVDVDLSTIENKAVRLNITLPARVVALVDEAAASPANPARDSWRAPLLNTSQRNAAKDGIRSCCTKRRRGERDRRMGNSFVP